MSQRQNGVAIIGGGPGGLTLALALHRQSIPCEVYELRPASYTHGGAVMLSPNALRILDRLGVYELMKPYGFAFEKMDFLTDSFERTGVYYFGSEKDFGYPGFRLYRNDLVQILTVAVESKDIPIHYERKFSHVVSETETDVTFAFADGETQTASRLVGADGTHSKVRPFFAPDLSPEYSGSLGITTAIPHAKLRIPYSRYSLPASVASKLGAFVMAPQDPKGSEVFLGRQIPFEGRDRQGWDDLLQDQQELRDLLTAQKDGWPDLIQSAMEATEVGKLNIWPFHALPRVPTWSSPKGKVIIIGDAAHSIPPTAGQGANQAFEDAFTLAWLLHKRFVPDEDAQSPAALSKWYDYRQSRVARVMELNRRMGMMRLPLDEQGKQEGFDANFASVENMRWLFGPDVEKEMKEVYGESCKTEHLLQRISVKLDKSAPKSS